MQRARHISRLPWRGPASARTAAAPFALAVAAVACWVATVRNASGVGMGRVDGFGAAPSFAAAWLAMMAAMMLPSALPALASARRRWLASTVTYLAIWELAGVVAYVAGRALFAHASTAELGIAFAAAGGYELSPLKRSCLARCRAAATTAGGSTGRYGWDCVGCSAGLMLALVAVGAMSLAWMVAIAAVLVVQKVTAIGPRAPTATGMLLLALGAWAVLAASSVPSVILGG